MNDRPLVSALLTNYDYAAYLPDAIESVLAQTYPAIEVVVVDDGSTDGSLEILESYPVRVLHQQNAGQASALNAGIAAARGEILCLLDADDGWAPSKVERVVDAFAANPRCSWLRHKLAFVDSTRRSLNYELPRFSHSGPIPRGSAAVRERVITASTSAIACRRGAAAEVFPLPGTRHLQYDADALLLARLGQRFDGWQLDEVLGWYRRHDRQQYAVEDDLRRMLERQVVVGRMIAADLAQPEPVSNYKHRAVLNSLEGRSHLGEIAGGLRASLGLSAEPLLMARQMASLLNVAVAPRRWVENLKRRQWSG